MVWVVQVSSAHTMTVLGDGREAWLERGSFCGVFYVTPGRIPPASVGL